MSDHPDDIVDTPPRAPLAMAPTWPDMAYWREVAMHHGAEAQRLRTELAFARQLIAELTRRPPPAPPAKSTPAPFPARALRTWR